MTPSVHKTVLPNRPQPLRFYPALSNGKEKDYESGFHYYGARYYWSELLTGWLSVDPLADKYPSISPYAYCAWNPVKLVDSDGRDVEIVKDDENKKVSIRANFYYNRDNLGPEADVFLAGFEDALNSWKADIIEALRDESLGAHGYQVDFEFNCKESDDPKAEAKNDRIGNSLMNDPEYYEKPAIVSGNRHFKANLKLHSRGTNPDAYDPVFYNTKDIQGDIKHEIEHFFGLYDRYNNGGTFAPSIPNDLMDKPPMTRGNAVEPFKRVWRSAGLDANGTKSVLINKKNRETW